MGRSNDPLITNATGDYATQGTALSVPAIAADADAPTDDVAVARAQVEHTRHDMSETLDAIREKLNPKELMEQAKTTVTDAAHNVLDQAKTTVHNVVSDVSEHAKEAAKDAVTGAVSGVVDEATAGVKNVVSGVKGAFSHAAEGVSDAVSNVMGHHHDKTPSANNAGLAGTQPNSLRSDGTRQKGKGGSAPVPFALLLSAGYYFFNRRSAAPVKPPVGRRGYQNPMNAVRPGPNAGEAGEVADITIVEEEVTRMPSNGNYTNGSRNGANGVLDTLTEHGSSLLDTAKRNPIPTALLLGSAWYLLNQRAERQRQGADPELWTDYTEYDNDYDAVPTIPTPEKPSGGLGETVSHTLHSVGDKAGDVKDSVTGALSSAASSVKTTAGNVASSVKSTAGNVADTTKQTASHVADAAGNALTGVKTTAASAVSSAKNTATGASSSLLESVRRDPVTMGAIALGLGAAVGLLLPGTEKENQVLGQTRDKLVDRATQSATELASKVQHVAGESFSAAKDALQETVTQTVQTAKEHAQTVKETAQHEARDQGLIP